MTNTNEGWIWKFDRWVIDTEKELIYKPIGERIVEGFKGVVGYVWDSFVPIIPDLIGYGAVATGVLVILSTMAGRGAVKPLGYFGGVTVLAICILEAS